MTFVQSCAIDRIGFAHGVEHRDALDVEVVGR
jgi:hypothetical protein